MPYNTRRISLSLPSLGVHLPGSNSSRANNRSSSATDANAPPSKRLKRSHTLSSVTSSPSTSTPPRLHSRHSSSVTVPPAGPAAEHTPPPSPPGQFPVNKLETDGINDDIVVAVLKQLEKTGNRPHLIKELVAVLINSLRVVESSANPAAIISSRLTNYLKRPWTALAPCPLAKEQTTTHPRAVYYFLTTTPRQQIPEFTSAPTASKRRITPSVSSGPEDDEEIEEVRKRRKQSASPAPEVEFTMPEVELSHAQDIADLSYSAHDFAHEEQNAAAHDANISHNRRAASPPLEHDEREFTQTASVMQMRRQSEQAEQQQQQSIPSPSESLPGLEVIVDEEEPDEEVSEERAALRNQEVAAALFGQSHHLLHINEDAFGGGSSPMLRPLQQGLQIVTTPKKALDFVDSFDLDLDSGNGLFDGDGGWELKSAESVELAELDDLLGGF